MSTEFTFVDALPPATRGRNDLYREYREALRARPGEWAQYPRAFGSKEAARTTTGNILRGNASYPLGEFEAVARDGVVYVRYIGGEK